MSKKNKIPPEILYAIFILPTLYCIGIIVHFISNTLTKNLLSLLLGLLITGTLSYFLYRRSNIARWITTGLLSISLLLEIFASPLFYALKALNGQTAPYILHA